MCNQFLFSKKAKACAFNFDQLVNLSVDDCLLTCDNLVAKIKSADPNEKRLFHMVLNRLISAHFEHKPNPPLDLSWQAKLLETKMITAWLNAEIAEARAEWQLPTKDEPLTTWFNRFVDQHPVSRHKIFDFLALSASLRQIAYYIFQENPSDANFEDLIISLQLGIGNCYSKMELARNYWDEMGHGNMNLAHTELYNVFLTEIRTQVPDFDTSFDALTEAISTGNYLLYVCKYRSTRYLGIGCLGVIERLFSEASSAMVKACVRLGIKTTKYHSTHSKMDIAHANRWSIHLFDRLEQEGQSAKEEMALGAILRLSIIGRMYDSIFKQFTLEHQRAHAA